jgi:hypothetical protein
MHAGGGLDRERASSVIALTSNLDICGTCVFAGLTTEGIAGRGRALAWNVGAFVLLDGRHVRSPFLPYVLNVEAAIWSRLCGWRLRLKRRPYFWVRDFSPA